MARSFWIALAMMVAAVFAFEATAFACPSCALNHQDGGALGQGLVAAMLVAPFVVTGGVFFAIRRALRK